MADALDTAYVKIRPETSGFEADATRNIKRAGAKGGETYGRAFGTSFKRTVAGVAGGFVLGAGIEETFRQTIGLIKDLGTAAKEEQSRSALLAVSLKNLGTATQLYGQNIDDVIEKESRAKGFTDTDLTDAFIRLNTAVHDSGKAFHDLQLAEDISRQRKIGVTQAALLLSRAEQGVFTSVRRLGLAVPALTKEEGKLSKERQKRILTTRLLNELEEKFGGTAAAVAKTATGATDRLHVAISELEEDIGQVLLPSITRVSNEVADFLGKEKNQERVQRDVNEALRVGGEVAHTFAEGAKLVKTVGEPLVNVVGGLADAVRLLIEAMAVSKVLKFAGALNLVGPAAVRAGAGVATAEGEMAAANTTAGKLGTSLGRLGAIGAIVIGIELVPKIAGSKLGKKLGADYSLLDLARDIGGSRPVKDLQAASADFLNQAIPGTPFPKGKSTPLTAGTPGFGGYSFLQQLLTGAIADRGAPAFKGFSVEKLAKFTRDQQYQLKVAQALTTQATADEEALYKTQLDYVDAQISRLTKEEHLTKAEHARLKQLYGAKASLQNDIGSIEDANRQAAEARAQEAKQRREQAKAEAEAAAQAKKEANQRATNLQEQRLQYRLSTAEATKTTTDDIRAHKALIKFYGDQEKHLRSIGAFTAALAAQASKQEQEQAISSIRQAEKDAHDQQVKERKARFQSLKEQRLQLAVQQAQLTKTNKDDIAATQALIKYYGSQEARLRKQGALAAALEARGNKVSAMLELKRLKDTGASGGVTDFFSQAISDFKQFGSNLSGPGGILSAQQSRGALAGLALANAAPDRAAQILAINSNSQLTEQQKQTRILQTIASALGAAGSGAPRKAGRRGTEQATTLTRQQAAVQFGRQGAD